MQVWDHMSSWGVADTGVALDPRILAPRTAMEATLLELIEQRDLTALSIADVTRAAGVSRSTFCTTTTPTSTSWRSRRAPQCSKHCCRKRRSSPTMPYRNPPIRWQRSLSTYSTTAGCTPPLGPDGSARVVGYLLHRLTIAIHVNRSFPADVNTRRDDPAEAPLDVGAAFCAGALIGVVVDWLRRGCPGTPKSMAAKTWPLMATVADA